MPPFLVFVNVRNVFFVKVACNSTDTCKHPWIEESVFGKGHKFWVHHLCLLELWVLTGSLISPFFPFTILIGLFLWMANKSTVAVCECVLCVREICINCSAKFFKSFSCVYNLHNKVWLRMEGAFKNHAEREEGYSPQATLSFPPNPSLLSSWGQFARGWAGPLS